MTLDLSNQCELHTGICWAEKLSLLPYVRYINVFDIRPLVSQDGICDFQKNKGVLPLTTELVPSVKIIHHSCILRYRVHNVFKVWPQVTPDDHWRPSKTIWKPGCVLYFYRPMPNMWEVYEFFCFWWGLSIISGGEVRNDWKRSEHQISTRFCVWPLVTPDWLTFDLHNKQ